MCRDNFCTKILRLLRIKYAMNFSRYVTFLEKNNSNVHFGKFKVGFVSVLYVQRFVFIQMKFDFYST